MLNVKNISDSVRALGPERLKLLSFIGLYGMKAAFLLTGGFVLLAAFVLLPLNLYRGSKGAG